MRSGVGVGCREGLSRGTQGGKGAYLVIAGGSVREEGKSPRWLVFCDWLAQTSERPTGTPVPGTEMLALCYCCVLAGKQGCLGRMKVA